MIKDKNVMLVAIDFSDETFEQKENRELIKSAGGKVLATGIQKNREIKPAMYFGSGKLEYFKNICQELNIDTVVVGHEISPSQLSNLVDFFDLQVLDRNMLILELFSQRAKTSFGKLQVELANKEYMLPRLIGAGKNMDRQAGVVGMRGAGEQKLELDRRRLRASIDSLRRELADQVKVEETKAKRRKRSAIPIVSLVGYSNTGKSTILNRILDLSGKENSAQVYADDRLFATLDTSAREVELPHGAKIILTDTVGLISHLPHQLVDAFSSTLDEIKYADLLVNVLDISNENLHIEEETMAKLLKDLNLGNKKILKVYNKIDKTDHGDFKEDGDLNISAFDDGDINKLLLKIEERLFGKIEKVNRKFSFDSQADMDEYIKSNKVLDIIYDENGAEVVALEYTGTSKTL